MTNQQQAVLVEYLKKCNSKAERKKEVYEFSLCIDDPLVQRAEQTAADLYGAAKTFFLTNGSTQGIHGLIMAACDPGDKILLPRNAHRSVLGGLVLSGAEPIFIDPVYSESLGFPLQIQTADVAKRLDQCPDCRAVMVVHPTYQGMAADITALAELCHSRRIPLLVDEAHGPHLGFHHRLPQSALQCGADGVVQSTHKWIGALTQSSMVHRQGNILNKDRFQESFALLREQDASLMLLASLDGARRQMSHDGERLLEIAIQLADWARTEIKTLAPLFTFDRSEILSAGVFDFDCTKLCVNVSGLGISGRDAEKFLRSEWAVQAELADIKNVLFLITIADTVAELEILISALSALAQKFNVGKISEQAMPILTGQREVAMSVQKAFFAEHTYIRLDRARGEISHTVLCPYPPGIPAVYPGEKITADVEEYLTEVFSRGIPVLGIDQRDGLPYIPVVRCNRAGGL